MEMCQRNNVNEWQIVGAKRVTIERSRKYGMKGRAGQSRAEQEGLRRKVLGRLYLECSPTWLRPISSGDQTREGLVRSTALHCAAPCRKTQGRAAGVRGRSTEWLQAACPMGKSESKADEVKPEGTEPAQMYRSLSQYWPRSVGKPKYQGLDRANGCGGRFLVCVLCCSTTNNSPPPSGGYDLLDDLVGGLTLQTASDSRKRRNGAGTRFVCLHAHSENDRPLQLVKHGKQGEPGQSK